ncbi:hypothetical protein PIROE2DRAFT_17676 [Piromyces sp. E2]|nr:hypothetical protein PIROE2DRAFT_17676 [Piromyces sp. E2]|eukprot:OUM57371.1 hypothetical protein PIROE2DRAFT_17676 [Piromyces sp. E2]
MTLIEEHFEENENINVNNDQEDIGSDVESNGDNQQIIRYQEDSEISSKKEKLRKGNKTVVITVQQRRNSSGEYILILAEIQGIITNSLYRKEMREEDFWALNERLFKGNCLYSEIQDKYEFLIGSFEEKIISIENLSEEELVLKIKYRAVGKSSYDMRIVLPKTNRETVITIEMLCREIQRLNIVVENNESDLKRQQNEIYSLKNTLEKYELEKIKIEERLNKLENKRN